jgi:hypothetical protein
MQAYTTGSALGARLARSGPFVCDAALLSRRCIRKPAAQDTISSYYVPGPEVTARSRSFHGAVSTASRCAAVPPRLAGARAGPLAMPRSHSVWRTASRPLSLLLARPIAGSRLSGVWPPCVARSAAAGRAVNLLALGQMDPRDRPKRMRSSALPHIRSSGARITPGLSRRARSVYARQCGAPAATQGRSSARESQALDPAGVPPPRHPSPPHPQSPPACCFPGYPARSSSRSRNRRRVTRGRCRRVNSHGDDGAGGATAAAAAAGRGVPGPELNHRRRASPRQQPQWLQAAPAGDRRHRGRAESAGPGVLAGQADGTCGTVSYSFRQVAP